MNQEIKNYKLTACNKKLKNIKLKLKLILNFVTNFDNPKSDYDLDKLLLRTQEITSSYEIIYNYYVNRIGFVNTMTLLNDNIHELFSDIDERLYHIRECNRRMSYDADRQEDYNNGFRDDYPDYEENINELY